MTLLLTMGGGAVVAQEDDNACYPGGLMEDDCTTEWHWECGWYLARWQANGGWQTMPFYPDWCAPEVLLPPLPQTPQTASGGDAPGFACVISTNGLNTFCQTGSNQFEIDFNTDGIIEDITLIFSSPTICPATAGSFSFWYEDTVDDFVEPYFSFLLSLGFGATDQICRYH
jgi:hypothetical protein